MAARFRITRIAIRFEEQLARAPGSDRSNRQSRRIMRSVTLAEIGAKIVAPCHAAIGGLEGAYCPALQTLGYQLSRNHQIASLEVAEAPDFQERRAKANRATGCT